MTDVESPDGQRVDQWLWFARIVKSRTLAQALIEGGKVRVNRTKIGKTSHRLKLGDAMTVTLGSKVRVFKVLEMGVRRGPAVEAAGLYQELTLRPDKTTSATQARPLDLADPLLPQARRLTGSGRPTKRERREIDRLKGRGRP